MSPSHQALFVKHSDIFCQGTATMHSPCLGWAWFHYHLWLSTMTGRGLHTISAIAGCVTLGHLLSC